jgi:hypothetical protein
MPLRSQYDSWLRDNGDLIGYSPQVQNDEMQKNLATLRQQDVLTQGGIDSRQSR